MLAWTTHLKGGPQGVHAAVTVGHKVYCIGGISDSSDTLPVHVFNTVSLHWVKLSPVTSTVEESPVEFPSKRLWGHTAVLIGHVIYVWGGVDAGMHSNVLYTFDVNTHRWFKPEVSGTIPEERRNHSACTLGKVMYIYGGINDTGHTNDICTLDTTTMVWSSINAGDDTLPLVTSCHSAAIIGEKMFVFDFDAVRVFDTNTNRWLSTPSTQLHPEGRWKHSSFVHNGELYIFGGEKYPLPVDDFWRFNPKTFSWKKIEPKGKGLRPTVSGCSCCVVGGQVVVCGGYRFKRAPGGAGGIWIPMPTNDLYILNLNASLTTLCKLAVIEEGLEQSELPHSIRCELASMSKPTGEIQENKKNVQLRSTSSPKAEFTAPHSG